MHVRERRRFLMICCAVSFTVATVVACLTWGRSLAGGGAQRLTTSACDSLSAAIPSADARARGPDPAVLNGCG